MGKVLVTGGKGFLGSHIVNRLLRQGAEVRVLARPGSIETQPPAGEYELALGDIRDAAAVERAMCGVDAVIHLASNFRKGGSDKDDAYATNVEGTQHVLNAAYKHGVQHVVHCSTIGVHGTVLEIPATELTPFNPTDLYQETKLVAERLVWKFYEKTQLPITVVRPISMIGPYDKRMLKLFRMIKKGRFLMMGRGDAFFQPSHVDDVVDGFMLVLHNKRAIGEAFLVGGEEYVPLRELVRTIAEQLRVAPPKLRIPLAPMLVAASVCEAVCAPLNVPPPLHRRRMSFFQNNRAFSVAKARRMLGYEPRHTLRQAVGETIRWYEDNRWL
jgi:dihydroflavonol-4-reductase